MVNTAKMWKILNGKDRVCLLFYIPALARINGLTQAQQAMRIV